MRRAVGLLTLTSLRVKEIGLHVGFRNPLSFSRTFKSYASKSLRAYRQSQPKP